MAALREARAHSAYDGAIANAVRRARQNPGDCFSVYFDGEVIYVRASEAPKPPDSILVCIAQRWDDRAVQLRFAGGHSEWHLPTI